MARCFERNRGGPGKVSPEGVSTDDVELTAIETLILSCVCSQGIPIWNENFSPFVTGDKNIDIVPPENAELSLCWTGLGKILVSAAKEWQACSTMKVEALQAEYEKYDDEEETPDKLIAQRNLANAIRIDDCKSIAVDQASEYALEPHILASKTIMLLERLRLRLGHYTGEHNKSTKKSNLG